MRSKLARSTFGTFFCATGSVGDCVAVMRAIEGSIELNHNDECFSVEKNTGKNEK